LPWPILDGEVDRLALSGPIAFVERFLAQQKHIRLIRGFPSNPKVLGVLEIFTSIILCLKSWYNFVMELTA
jgi:hypothetical protein